MKINYYKLYTLSFLILPIISSYDFLPINLLYFLGSAAVVIAISNRNIHKGMSVRAVILLYVGYCLIKALFPVNSISGIGLSTRLFGALRIVMILFAYFIGNRFLEKNYMYSVYTKICVVSSIFVFLQYIAHFFGRSFALIIPNIMINGTLSSNVYIQNQISTGRFAAFFLEPAHMAQYILPCLALNIFLPYKHSKKINVKWAVILTLGLFATTSMQGILGAVILWSFYLMCLLYSKNPKLLLRAVGIIIIAILIFSQIIKQPIIQEQFFKKISSFNSYRIIRGTSSYLRLQAGWDCFAELDILKKIFGIGYMYTYQFLTTTGLGLDYYTSDVVGYMNGISKMMFDIGIVGTILFFIAIYKEVKNNVDIVIVALFICMVIYLCTCDCFGQIILYLPLTIIFNRAYNNKQVTT